MRQVKGKTMAHFLAWLILMFTWIVTGPGVWVNGQTVIIDAFPGTIVEQGTSVVLVCRVVGVLSSDSPSFQWTCPGMSCPSGTVREQDNVLLVDVIDSATHAGMYTCNVTVGGNATSQSADLVVNSGIAFSSLNNSMFFPKNSLLTSNTSTVVCHSDSARPMWLNSDGTTVTMNTNLSLYQEPGDNTTQLVVTDIDQFTNGVYQCMSSAGNASLGLFIRSPAATNRNVSMLMNSASTMDTIDLTWSVSGSPNETGYFISFKRTDIPANVTPQWIFTEGPATSHNLGGLLGGTNYDITLRLVEGFGASDELSINARTNDGIPTAPRNLTLVMGMMGEVELDWLPPETPNGNVTYTVRRDGEDIATELRDTSYPVTNQSSGTAVSFTVVAVTNNGTSQESNSVSFCNNTGLISPNIISAEATSSSSITVMWDAISLDCPNIYRVVYDDGTGNNTVMPETAMTAVSIPGLPPFTNISVFVAALSDAGVGPAVEELVTTLLQAPTLTSNSSNATAISASWVVDQNAVQYNATLSGPNFTDMSQTSGASVTFENLIPATMYTLTVQGVDSMGRNGDPTSVNITTGRTAPSVPRNLTVTAITAERITVAWMEPEVLGDTSVSYNVTVNATDAGVTVRGLSAVISGLTAGTAYNISVTARNSVGASQAVTDVFMTPDQPAAVQDVMVTQDSNTSVVVTWTASAPAVDSTINGYQVEVLIVDVDGNTSNRNESVGNVSTTLLEMLSPGVPYFVRVMVNESQRGIGLPGKSEVFFSEELEPQNVTVQNVTAIGMGTNSIQVTWEAVPLIQARRFFNYTATLTVSSSKREAPNRKVVSCTAACSVNFMVEPGRSYIVQVGITGFQSTFSSSVSVIIPTPPAPTPTPTPTPTTTPTTTPPSAAPTSDSAGIIAGIVVAGVVVIGLLVAVLIVLFVFFYKSSGKRSEGYALRGSSRKLNAGDGTETSSAQNLISMSNLETDEQREQLVAEHKRIISLEEFPSYVEEMHRDRDQGYEEEYKLFRTDLVNTAKAALDFPVKNRYGNIFAYDHARVVMKDPDEEGCDYINASYMDGYGVKNAYIATQGPVPETIEDFWQMVWEQKTPIIIMLTRVDEGGRRKCEPYWPDTKEEPVETNRGVRVALTNIEPFADFEIRTFIVTCKKDPEAPALEVKHFYYTVWPDHGVPQYATSLIKFIRRVRKFQSAKAEESAPIIVHCSAGVGRSGTYICLDAMLQRMQKEENFNVFEFVTAMRDNRTYMVQTLDQYIFIHDAIHELIVCGDTSIPAPSIRIKVNRLLKTLPDSTRTGFQHQFELLNNVSHDPGNAEISEGLADYNKPKNRDQDCIPYNLGRPRLLGVGFHSGADYINGSLVDGYKTRNYFIATQGPLANTINDFWLMVWQNKVACIVMLCDTMEEDKESSAVYWSDEVGLNTVYGKITVTLKSSTEADGFVTRRFEVLEEGKAAPPLKVTQLHYKGWTDSSCPKDHKPLLKVIGDMEKVQQATGNNPIVVMCSNGTGRSGAYVTIYAQIERMKVEGIVDLFQYIKLARLQRVNLVQTLDQYTFCHELMVSYLDSFEGYANFEFK